MKWLLESQCKLPFSESDGRRADRPSAVRRRRRDGGVGHQGGGAQVEGPARQANEPQLDPILMSGQTSEVSLRKCVEKVSKLVHLI